MIGPSENGNGVTNKKNTAGLKPAWKKGQSGNPNGRPHSRTIAIRDAILKHASGRITKGQGKGRNRLVALIDRLYHEDPKTYLAYAFGKPVETHEVSGPSGAPMEFTINLTGQELEKAFPDRIPSHD